MVYFNTNKTQSFFFLQNTNYIEKSQVIFGGGGGAGGPPCSLPLDLPLAHPANWRNGTNIKHLQFTVM